MTRPNTNIPNTQHTLAGTAWPSPQATARPVRSDSDRKMRLTWANPAGRSQGCRGVSPCLPALASASGARESTLERSVPERQEGKGRQEPRDWSPLHPQAVAGKQLTQTNNWHSARPPLDTPPVPRGVNRRQMFAISMALPDTPIKSVQIRHTFNRRTTDSNRQGDLAGRGPGVDSCLSVFQPFL